MTWNEIIFWIIFGGLFGASIAITQYLRKRSRGRFAPPEDLKDPKPKRRDDRR
jgi:hypothetical protein